MFFWQALEGKISLSLDAWTSSNCYAFLAIISHYITNQGQCGECLNNFSYFTSKICPLAEEQLIDFRELIGQHSGENMAAAVWSTLETYDILSKVRKFYINKKLS